MKRFTGIISLILFSTLLTPASGGREECFVCGMWIDQYMSTRHEVRLNHGISRSFCSLACTARFRDEHREEIAEIRAADYLSHALTDAEGAYYLEGSDIPGVMSHTSRLAFSRKEEAERFRKKHGGRVITFGEAIRNQLGG